MSSMKRSAFILSILLLFVASSLMAQHRRRRYVCKTYPGIGYRCNWVVTPPGRAGDNHPDPDRNTRTDSRTRHERETAANTRRTTNRSGNSGSNSLGDAENDDYDSEDVDYDQCIGGRAREVASGRANCQATAVDDAAYAACMAGVYSSLENCGSQPGT